MTGDEIPTKLSKGSGEGDNERPQRMKDWLIEQINSNSYDGLQWVDDDKTIFRVPWIHAKKRGYNPERDAALFRAWAKHTGKYKGEGDATTWKINFRCALNGLKDIVELKDNQTENFRMYRLLPDTKRRPHPRPFTGRDKVHGVPQKETMQPMFPTYPPYPFPPYFPTEGPYDFPRCPPWTATAVFPPSFIEPPICISYPPGLEDMKPFPQSVVGGINVTPVPKPTAMPVPCISTAPACPLGPPPQYPPADAVSYGGEYLGEPSPKRICMKPDPALEHPTCPLSYSQANPVYSEASPASASSGSSLNIEDETQHSPCHRSPAHIGYPPTSVTSPCDQTNLTSTLPFEYPHPLTPPQAPPPSGPQAIQVSLSYDGATLRTENIVCTQAGCHVFANLWNHGEKEVDHQLAAAFPFKMPAPLSQQVHQILDSFTRGLLIEVSNKDIYVTNLTPLACYHGASPSNLAQCHPLPLDQRVKVFDYGLFQESLDAHFRGQSEAPCPSVALTVGEPWGHGRHLSQTSISIVVTLLQAQHELESGGIRRLPEFFIPPPGPAPPTHDFHTAPL